MPDYATQTDFEAYLPNWVTENVTALNQLLVQAERDIDLFLQIAHLDPTALDADTADALKNATCAQAEYRYNQGDDFFLNMSGATVQGPDFTITGGNMPKISPQALLELRRGGLLLTTARARP